MIKNFFNSVISLDEILEGIPEDSVSFATSYLDNSIADAEFTYKRIKDHLKNEQKILEVGGGLHILSLFLISKGFKVTSLEPGDFNPIISKLRSNFLNKINQDFIFTCYLEDFISNEKYDFIFQLMSLNTLKIFINTLKK